MLSRLQVNKLMSRVLLFSICFGAICFSSHAGDALLKNGMKFEGAPVPIVSMSDRSAKQKGISHFKILMISTGMKWYFIPHSSLLHFNNNADLGREVSFAVKQPRRRPTSALGRLGAMFDVGKFSRFGVRSFSINVGRKKIDVVQGVVKITPQYLLLRSLTHKIRLGDTTHPWEQGIATTTVPRDQLDAMIRQATDQKNPDDRFAIARFYLQVGYFPKVEQELQSIIREFPTLKVRVAEVQKQLPILKTRRILTELRKRQSVGQHSLVIATVEQLNKQKNLDLRMKREIDTLSGDYKLSKKKIEDTKKNLIFMHTKIKDDEALSKRVKSIIDDISTLLNYDSIALLDAFSKLSVSKDLTGQQKLALAISGWCLGSENSLTDLKLSVRLWDARKTVIEYLRENDKTQKQLLLSRLKGVEGIGPRVIQKMIPQLPAIVATPQANLKQSFEVSYGKNGSRTKYTVKLPPEYDPFRKYPMIVALKPAERSCEDEIIWWAGSQKKQGQAQRHGYIVIAPDYTEGRKEVYKYDMRSHEIVLAAIRDARKRFRVDSDRIFLTGHGSGGDAAFDIGMSHPHVFAGVIPIAATAKKYCYWYWPNTVDLPFYIVSGELCRDSPTQNARVLNSMMRARHDVIYVEYLGRGYESYYEEIHRLFEWMNLQQRNKYPTEFEMKLLRPSESHFYWMKANLNSSEYTDTKTFINNLKKRLRVKIRKISLKIYPNGDRIAVRNSGGAKSCELWLSPELIDFDKKLKVSFRGKSTAYYDFVTPDTEALLEDFRFRGDREKTFLARIRLK